MIIALGLANTTSLAFGGIESILGYFNLESQVTHIKYYCCISEYFQTTGFNDEGGRGPLI